MIFSLVSVGFSLNLLPDTRTVVRYGKLMAAISKANAGNWDPFVANSVPHTKGVELTRQIMLALYNFKLI